MKTERSAMIELAHKVSMEQLGKLNPKSSHLLRLVRNIDLLLNDAKILEANGGTSERVLFLHLTAFEQLRVLIARFDDLEKLPFNHKEKLAPLETHIAKIKEILDIKDGSIIDLRNSCLYEDEHFETKHKLAKYITHVTEFIPELSTLCTELLLYLENRWNNSFKAYVDLGCDKNAYERSYTESKKK